MTPPPMAHFTLRAGKYRMSREQYGALRRKVGGTGKDFFKEWVEEERPNACEC